MTFDDLLADIKALVGKKLQSIRPGADIMLDSVWKDEGRIELITAKGKRRSRPIAELERIWEGLKQAPAVHVDSVLAGSGSSRNQPETIMASLPYVAWLIVGGRKHIALLDKATHAPGTLQELDPIEAEGIRAKLREMPGPSSPPTAILVVKNVASAVARLGSDAGVSAVAARPLVYRVYGEKSRILLVGAAVPGLVLAVGTYAVVDSARAVSRDIGLNIDGFRIGAIDLEDGTVVCVLR